MNKQKLFESIKIGNVEIKNRIAMAPMANIGLITPDGCFTKRAVDYYVERAKGGTGLIITGAVKVENEIEKLKMPSFPCITTNPTHFIQTASELTERVHAYGAKIFIQITLGLGRSGAPGFLDGQPVAPSAIPNYWDPTITCRELTTEEVETMVKRFGEAALIAKESGFDGIEIHAVHEGYLLDQFTLSIFNRRTDKYGGDLKGRLTFAIEIVQTIKKACGPDFPVILRFSIKSYIKALRQGGLPEEEFEELGRDVSEALQAAKILEEAGYDAFDADAGTYDSWYWAHPPMYFKKGLYLPLTEQLKKVVNVPVMVAGRMEDPDMAIKALEDGKLDAVGLGRQLLTDPEYPNKLKNDEVENIRPCLGCHDGCFARLLQGGRGSCAVNPECGRELFVGITPAIKSKNVVVVGGGPAGMEAARVSALRGYKVTLFEATNNLGGELVIGGVPSFKEDDRALIKWYEHQMKALSVDVKLNTKATKENIKTLNPDLVYIAEGSEPVKLNLPGIDSEKVVNAGDVLSGKKTVGEKCVIIGGGLVGCELALHLKSNNHNVTIVEAMQDILKSGAPMAPMNEWMLRDLLAFNKIELITNTCISKIIDAGAIVTSNGEEKIISADNIIIAVGFKSKNTIFEELKYDYSKIFNLGDGKKVRNIRAAIWDAYEVARSM